MTVYTFAILTNGQHVYVYHFLLSLVTDDKRISMLNNTLVLRTTRLSTVVDWRSHVIMIDKDGIQNTTFVDRATPVPAKTDGATRITSNTDQPARITELKIHTGSAIGLLSKREIKLWIIFTH